MDYTELDNIFNGMSEDNLDNDIAAQLVPYVIKHRAEFDTNNIPERHSYLKGLLSDMSEVPVSDSDYNDEYEFVYDNVDNDGSEPTDITSTGKTKEDLNTNNNTMKNIVGSLIDRI